MTKKKEKMLDSFLVHNKEPVCKSQHGQKNTIWLQCTKKKKKKNIKKHLINSNFTLDLVN